MASAADFMVSAEADDNAQRNSITVRQSIRAAARRFFYDYGFRLRRACETSDQHRGIAPAYMTAAQIGGM
jgi:hypothetical protein